jgi:dTDP-4-dehydrorhamnose 3,5-epimerase
MSFSETGIPGLLVFEPKVFGDSRGYFFESYNEKNFTQRGIRENFVQDNESSSAYGVIRGLHYQASPYEQAKLMRVIEGRILDVVVDIRKGSPSYGKSYSIELTGENKKQLFIPVGFAHGFSVLSEKAVVLYKCSNFYNKESEGGIRYDDPQLSIDWKIPAAQAIVSDKDKILPLFADNKSNFVF